ncbi:MAG TPA: hypothetical protein VHK63_04635 [Candidatus Limnocylindria bacterium]|nr:hypothetical protein [Candidatus Limnocylindria bacterium]
MTSTTNHPARPRRSTRPRWRPATPAALLLLGGIFAAALLAPIPAGPNAARAEVVERVEAKLPGWAILRTDSSWEGAWTVVAACGANKLGFQFVPGHGLAPGDAWLLPQDAYSRTRLQWVSDHRFYLVWFDERRGRELPCRTELARTPDDVPRGRNFD